MPDKHPNIALLERIDLRDLRDLASAEDAFAEDGDIPAADSARVESR